MAKIDKPSTVFLPHGKDWHCGFVAGLAYMLMLQQCPMIAGVYDSMEEEQLFLFASQMGYEIEWRAMKTGNSEITFTLKDVENN